MGYDLNVDILFGLRLTESEVQRLHEYRKTIDDTPFGFISFSDIS